MPTVIRPATMRSTKKRYHDHYKTAQDVDRDLEALGLPTLKNIKGEMEKKAKRLGIK